MGLRASFVARIAVAWIGAAVPTAAAAQEERSLEAGAVKVRFAPRPGGLQIWFDGVAVSSGSEIIVTTPPWAPHFYVGPGAAAVADSEIETFEGGRRLRVTHRGQNQSFLGSEIIEVFDDDRVTLAFEGRLADGVEQALIQFRMAGLNPAVLVGRPYRVVLRDGAERSDTVPVLAKSVEVEASALAKGFQRIEFDSRVGPIRVEVESDRELVLYDHRKSRWANPKHPLFWLGDLGTRLSEGESVQYRITYQFPRRAEPRDAGAERAVTVEVRRRPSAQMPSREDPPLVIPRPKEFTLPDRPNDSGFVLRGSPQVPVLLADPAIQRQAADEFARHVTSISGELDIGPMPAEPGATAIRFENTPQAMDHPPEGYEIQAERSGIRIRASDPRGFMHAVQTLKQLTTISDTGQPVIRSATVRDWPSLPFRGVHLFTGSKGPALHKTLLRDVIAALKMNRLVLEAEYVRWDSHPELHHPERGMPKSDVREIVELCRSLQVEVIPLINTLGHCQWMFHGGVNLDLAEDPEAQWAYCVTNPKTYEFVFDVFQETLDLFQPKTLHIGHDEFTHRGRYPFREESKKRTPEALLMLDTLKLHAWLKERDVRTMLWGDMFLGKGEGTDAMHAASAESAATLRATLPKDVVVADWHYAAASPDAFVSLGKFHQAGLETVAATWNRPDNIFNFARAAFEKRSQGLLQTTWAGYSLDPESFQKEIDQYVAYVLAAEAAWNADRSPPQDHHRYAWRFFELMGLSALAPERRAGWTADLSAARNYALAASDGNGWFGLGPPHDLRGIPHGWIRMKGIEFELAPPADKSALVLVSKLARDPGLPRSIRLALDATAEKIIILHTTPFVCPAGEVLGQYGFTYEDGSGESVDVVYGTNLFACDDLAAAAQAPAVWWGENDAGQTLALRALVWNNPRPAERLRAVTLRSADGSAPLVVLAVTGLIQRLGPAD